MIWETRRHEEEIGSLRLRLDSVTSEASHQSVLRVEKETKLVELDNLIGQLLAVNETLVDQLSGPSRGTRPAKKAISSAVSTDTTGVKKVKKKRSKSAVPRVASVSTASSDAKTSAPASSTTTARRKTSTDGDNQADRLRGMHDMYVALARNITGHKKTTGGRSSVGGSVSSVGSRKETSMRARSRGRERERERGVDMGQAQAQGDLSGVIASLEDEFSGLSLQYQQLLAGGGGRGRGEAGEDRNRELVSVIQRLHKKGEQLRALKSPLKK
jgi:hypothetical protein